MSSEKSLTPRSRARICVFKAIFAWLIAGEDIKLKLQEVIDDQGQAKIDLEYASDLAQKCVEYKDETQKKLLPFTKKVAKSKISDVENAILQLAATELYYCYVPKKVVINEAVNLAKTFGSEGGYKFVNAVLDAMVKSISVDKKNADK